MGKDNAVAVKILHRARDGGAPPGLSCVELPFSPDDALAADIDRHWSRLSKRSADLGRTWYNGELWSPVGVQAGTVQVRQGYFRDYIGTRHLPASVLAHERISPVSVAILPVEVDRPGGRIKALRFFRRAGHSLDFAGYFSGLGGLMEPQSDGLDPQVTAIREVGEECGLTITGDDLTYLGTASIGPTHAISYCYLLEVTQQMMQQGFTFSDGEMTHSIKMPTATVRLLQWKLTPAAAWVKEFCRLVTDQHGHRF